MHVWIIGKVLLESLSGIHLEEISSVEWVVHLGGFFLKVIGVKLPKLLSTNTLINFSLVTDKTIWTTESLVEELFIQGLNKIITLHS